MTILEILKQKKPFKREGWSSLLYPSDTYSLSQEDLMADDWVIPEPETSLSQKKLKTAWRSTVEPYLSQDPDLIFENFSKELGVK
jgi:hypothetical protein